MFVRVRQIRQRLFLSLEMRHPASRTSTEYVASLGSIALPEPIPEHERARFWDDLVRRLRALPFDRVSIEDRR
jgi:hypothetical protein